MRGKHPCHQNGSNHKVPRLKSNRVKLEEQKRHKVKCAKVQNIKHIIAVLDFLPWLSVFLYLNILFFSQLPTLLFKTAGSYFTIQLAEMLLLDLNVFISNYCPLLPISNKVLLWNAKVAFVAASDELVAVLGHLPYQLQKEDGVLGNGLTKGQTLGTDVKSEEEKKNRKTHTKTVNEDRFS